MATSSHSSASFTAYGELCETLARPFFLVLFTFVLEGEKIKEEKEEQAKAFHTPCDHLRWRASERAAPCAVVVVATVAIILLFSQQQQQQQQQLADRRAV